MIEMNLAAKKKEPTLTPILTIELARMYLEQGVALFIMDGNDRMPLSPTYPYSDEKLTVYIQRGLFVDLTKRTAIVATFLMRIAPGSEVLITHTVVEKNLLQFNTVRTTIQQNPRYVKALTSPIAVYGESGYVFHV